MFKLVGKFFLNGEEVNDTKDNDKHDIQTSTGVSQATSGTEAYILQELLLVLEDICSSPINDTLQEVCFSVVYVFVEEVFFTAPYILIRCLL